MITSNDIAKAAGVSRGTVDRVLHNRGNVAADKEKKIRELAKQLGYKPDIAGKGLAAKKKQFKIGFCYPDALFHRALYQGAREYVPNLEQYGMTVSFFPISENYIQNDDIKIPLHSLIENHSQIDGWIVTGSPTPYFYNELLAQGLSDKPVIFCGNNVPDANCLAFVGCDYFQAGILACGLAAIATHETGKIAIISLDDGKLASSATRITGFEKEMRECYPKMEIIKKYFLHNRTDYDKFEKTIVEWAASVEKLDIIYITNPNDYSICKALFPLARERNFQIITNDLVSEEERIWIREKKLLGVICQEPELQGQKALEIMFNYLAFGKKPEQKWYKPRLSILIRQNV